jgi:hypothetical protein
VTRWRSGEHRRTAGAPSGHLRGSPLRRRRDLRAWRHTRDGESKSYDGHEGSTDCHRQASSSAKGTRGNENTRRLGASQACALVRRRSVLGLSNRNFRSQQIVCRRWPGTLHSCRLTVGLVRYVAKTLVNAPNCFDDDLELPLQLRHASQATGHHAIRARRSRASRGGLHPAKLPLPPQDPIWTKGAASALSDRAALLAPAQAICGVPISREITPELRRALALKPRPEDFI